MLTPILSDEPESFTYFNLILFMNRIKYSLLIIYPKNVLLDIDIDYIKESLRMLG